MKYLALAILLLLPALSHAGYEWDAFEECELTASEVQELHHSELEEYLELCIEQPEPKPVKTLEEFRASRDFVLNLSN